MTITVIFALFTSMLLLAVIPGPGVLVVVSRTLGSGLSHGLTTIFGIILGDFIFISFALLGLFSLANLMGSLFIFVKFLGAGYLIWMGLSLIFSTSKAEIKNHEKKSTSYLSSFFVGSITTLANPKAIFFYISFFPSFLDITLLTSLDFLLIYTTAFVAIGGVMMLYAFIALRSKTALCSKRSSRAFSYVSGSFVAGSGVYLALKP